MECSVNHEAISDAADELFKRYYVCGTTIAGVGENWKLVFSVDSDSDSDFKDKKLILIQKLIQKLILIQGELILILIQKLILIHWIDSDSDSVMILIHWIDSDSDSAMILIQELIQTYSTKTWRKLPELSSEDNQTESCVVSII